MSANLERRGAGFGIAHADAHDSNPGPCLGCVNAERCGLQSLACEAFRSFVTAGGSDKWKLKPRRPSRAMFEELFREDDLSVGGRPR